MKRKLKDLKENECIKVNTLAQAKYFIDKLGWDDVKPSQLVGNFIAQEEKGHFVWIDFLAGQTEYPASDFIKPKKNGMVKTLEAAIKACKQLAKTQQKTNEYLEVLNGKNERIENTEHLQDSSKMEHTELEEGKWYMHKNRKDLCFREGESGNFGFINHEWKTNIHCKNVEEWVEATPEEVTAALVKEAINKGFKGAKEILPIGVKSKTEVKGIVLNNEDKLLYDPETNTLFMCKEPINPIEFIPIFYNGKWAEIIETEKIDWSKPGQLVVACDGEGQVVIITDGLCNKDSGIFSGTVVRADNLSTLGEYFKAWDIKDFKPYKGTITLKND